MLALAPSRSDAAAPRGGGGGDWSSPGLAVEEDESAPKFFKTANGVLVQQLSEGSGPVVARGDRVLLDFVLRRANGYVSCYAGAPCFPSLCSLPPRRSSPIIYLPSQFIYATVEGVSFQPADVPAVPVAVVLVRVGWGCCFSPSAFMPHNCIA